MNMMKNLILKWNSIRVRNLVIRDPVINKETFTKSARCLRNMKKAPMKKWVLSWIMDSKIRIASKISLEKRDKNLKTKVGSILLKEHNLIQIINSR